MGKSGEPWNRSAIALTKKQSLFLMACGFPVVMLLDWLSEILGIRKYITQQEHQELSPVNSLSGCI